MKPSKQLRKSPMIITLAASGIMVLSLSAQNNSLKTNEPISPTTENDSIAGYDYDILDELIVTGERPVLQSDGAKTTYNVDEDPSANGSSVLDILKKIPMVTVDGEGNVKLQGQSNFKFQINGMDNPMMAQYASQILKGMPASSIKKIEIITEPGAKEDAEGGVGIINIILNTESKQDGLSGSIDANISNNDGGVNAYAILKENKVTLSANIAYQGSISKQKNLNEGQMEYLTGDEGFLYTKSKQTVSFNYLGGNLNMSWEPDSLNLLSAGANFMLVDGAANPLLTTTERILPNGNLLWKYSQNGRADLGVLSLSANASFRHNFHRPGNHIIFSYLLNFGRNTMDMNRSLESSTDYPATAPYTSNGNSAFTREHTAQIDYANDFSSEKHLLEVGAKGIFRRNGSFARYFEGKTAGEKQIIEDQSLDLSQPQDIYAVYGSYTGNFDKLTTLAGVRYEHSYMGIKYKKGFGGDFTKRLNDVVPNAALTWKFSQMSNLRLAYQMRISRPTIQQINPYKLSLDEYQIQTGNPDLQSETSHKLSLNFTKFGRLLGGSIGIEQTFVNNAITSFYYVLPNEITGQNALYSSYANIGHHRITALNGFINWNIIPHMSLNLSGRVSYNYLDAPAEELKNDGFSGNFNGSWNYTVKEVWNFNLYGGWSARDITLQGYNSGWSYYGISASRHLLKDKSLTITLSANNFLTPKQSFRNYSSNKEIINYSCWRNETNWRAGIALSWKFGNQNTRVKETGADLSSDDKSAATNSSKGSGL